MAHAPAACLEPAANRNEDQDDAPNLKIDRSRSAEYGHDRIEIGRDHAKQDQQQKAKQKKVETKGIRIGFRTDKHDLLFKKTQAEKFLGKGNKVRVEIVLRGREKAMLDKARANITEFIQSIAIPHRFEEDIKRGPMGFNATIVPE